LYITEWEETQGAGGRKHTEIEVYYAKAELDPSRAGVYMATRVRGYGRRTETENIRIDILMQSKSN
jgi:hypothetical protein